MVDKNKAKNIEAKDRSNVIQGDNNSIITTIINFIPASIIKFISNNTGFLLFFTMLVVAIISNPSAETQLNKVQKGMFKNYELYKNIFYGNKWFFSCIYVLNESGHVVPLSYGLYGLTLETSHFTYNQILFSKKILDMPVRNIEVTANELEVEVILCAPNDNPLVREF